MPPQKSQKDTPRTPPVAPSPQASTPVIGEKPTGLRAWVDETFGADYKILAEGKHTVYIQNTRTGFKILKPTGERPG